MRTIKTYIKGAPFYIASAYRNVGFVKFPVNENAVSREESISLLRQSYLA